MESEDTRGPSAYFYVFAETFVRDNGEYCITVASTRLHGLPQTWILQPEVCLKIG